jgi:hypothetical protein
MTKLKVPRQFAEVKSALEARETPLQNLAEESEVRKFMEWKGVIE